MTTKEKIEQFLEKLLEDKDADRERIRKRIAEQKKRRGEERENFFQLYGRTCANIFNYSYDCTGNVKDAELIMRDAVVYMHDHIGELRSHKSVDAWQRECVESAFTGLLRSQLLERVEDGSNLPRNYRISEEQSERIWSEIIKFSEVDPWRLVPIPQKSTIFSVIADQTISDLRYMSPVDIISNVAIIFIGFIFFVAIIVLGVKLISDYSEKKADTMQEIFLDEEYYRDYDLSEADGLDKSKLEAVISQGSKYDVDEEGNIISFTAPKPIGDTAGSPEYTGIESVDSKLREVIAEVIHDDMSDPEKVWALYQHVGSTLVYSKYEGRGEDTESVLLDVLELKSGTSLHYATYFAALANAAGYHCDVISGSFILNRGTEFEIAADHYWNRMSLNGVVYYLDVEADCDATGTVIRDYYFMAADGNERWELFERDHD